MRTRIICREEIQQHHDEATEAGPADEHACDQAEGNEKFADRDQSSEEDCMRQDYFCEKRKHEGVTSVLDEVADVGGHPVLDEGDTGEFVLGEDEEEKADSDSQQCQRSRLLGGSAHFFFCWTR